MRGTAIRLVSLAAVFTLLGLNSGRSVEAIDPPSVPPPPQGMSSWDDNLIPQKMGQIYAAELNPPFPYITEGAFYDVGRLPDPKQGQPTDYGDYRFRVTHIKFDWKTNLSTSGTPPQTSATHDEGFTIMYEQDTNLAHVADDKVKGEWIYKYFTPDPDNAGRCEPALYTTEKSVKVKARIECAAPVKYAYVGAKELRAPAATGTQNDLFPRQWRDVRKTAVAFKELMPGKVWVSNEQDGTDADGNPVFSEYVTLDLVGLTRNDVNRSDIIWQWYVDRVNSTDPLTQPNTQNEWTARRMNNGNKDGWAINKSGKYIQETITDDAGNTITYDVMGPHQFYTVLDWPKNPWYDTSDNSNLESAQGKQKPWVIALEYAIITAGKIRLQGKTDVTDVATRVTVFCYKERLMEYNSLTGNSAYIYFKGLTAVGVLTGNIGNFELDLKTWLIEVVGGATRINCYDQALTVTSMSTLIGCASKAYFLEPFGYLKPCDLVGGVPRGNDCNNPFFEQVTVYNSVGKVGTDDTYWRFMAAPMQNVRKRSFFISHSWMQLAGGIFDATAGAANSDAPRVNMDSVTYEAAAIDLTHVADTPWEDNELLAIRVTSTFDDHGHVTASAYDPAFDPGDPAVPRDPSNKPDPNFKHGDMSKAKALTFKVVVTQ